MIQAATSFLCLLEPYRVVLCDVWGVIHNGVAPFPEAVAALERARGLGKLVVLVSNAPRPSSEIPAQLARIGVAADAYDLIVTSGDAARQCLVDWAASRPLRIHHIGPPRDLSLFAGLAVKCVALREASHVVCTGPFDDEADTPEDYLETLTEVAWRQLPFLCANPDIVVQRGERLIYCAGALAQELEKLGGEAIYPGKPHAPIYELALARLQDRAGCAIGKHEILAVGCSTSISFPSRA
jgi:HAD superfamily hydrolase (TIGR01459 family)